MNTILANYQGTDGRISRQPFWIGAIIIGVIQIVIALLIFPAMGMGAATPGGGWASLILFLIIAYPLYSLMVKRRHDKDNNGLDALIYLVLIGVLQLVQAFGLAFTIVDVNGTPVPTPTTLYWVLTVVVGIYAIYMLVVLGFLKGTAGPNTYGPDPLGGA
jgi:uncharacterized membrane protein YhaH (DUF805 family)